MVARDTMQKYRNLIKRDVFEFKCPHCQVLILPKKYEKHCHEQRNIDPLLKCVWCPDNKRRHTFQRRKKYLAADHLINCYLQFKIRIAKPLPEEDDVSVPDGYPFNFNPMCENNDFFGHDQIFPDGSRAYEPVWEIELPEPPVSFQDHSLNLAAACVLKYLQSDLIFIHVMVRATAYESFLYRMDEDNGNTRTLPFSCWCDGGTESDPKFRHHRHMIVVSPSLKYFQKNVWNKIQPEDRPYSGFKCILSKNIKTVWHLVNTLGYLSKRRSKCNFSFDDCLEAGNLNHFYIQATLPKDYRLVLATLWDRGIIRVLNQRYHVWEPKRLLEGPMSFVDGKWRIKIKHLPQIILNMVLPVSETLKSTSKPTERFLHLIDGKKMYFKPGNRTERDYKLFFGIVKDEWWEPCKLQQACFMCAKPYMQICDELKKEISEMKTLYEQETQDLRKKLEALHEDNRRLHEDNRRLQEDNRRLHEIIYNLQNDEIVRLKKENDALKAKNAKLKLENSSFKINIKRFKTENLNLKAENVSLASNAKRLKTENIQLKDAKSNLTGLELRQ